MAASSFIHSCKFKNNGQTAVKQERTKLSKIINKKSHHIQLNIFIINIKHFCVTVQEAENLSGVKLKIAKSSARAHSLFIFFQRLFCHTQRHRQTD